MTMQLYIDGSGQPDPHDRTQLLGWGLVGLHNDSLLEHAGVVRAPRHLSSEHEIVAFVRAVQFVQALKVPFESLSLFTDDEALASAAQALHEANYRQQAAERLRTRIANVCELLQLPELETACLQCLTTARMYKVKAHKRTVYNNRADYLANRTARRLTNPNAEILPFEAWLARGFVEYCPESKGYSTWYPPFVAAANEVPLPASESVPPVKRLAGRRKCRYPALSLHVRQQRQARYIAGQ